LSVYGILLLQRKPKLGRTKPSTGPHAGRGLDIAGLAAHQLLGYSLQEAVQIVGHPS